MSFSTIPACTGTASTSPHGWRDFGSRWCLRLSGGVRSGTEQAAPRLHRPGGTNTKEHRSTSSGLSPRIRKQRSVTWRTKGGVASSRAPLHCGAPLHQHERRFGPQYFADGMVEDITTALSRMRWLFVIARNSAFTYKGRAVDVRQVGRELGIRYVLEGSVRKAGNRVRITGQLIDASTGAHLWQISLTGRLMISSTYRTA